MDFLAGFDPVHYWHVNVQDDCIVEVSSLLLHLLVCNQSILGRVHLEIRLELRAEIKEQELMVVNDQNVPSI